MKINLIFTIFGIVLGLLLSNYFSCNEPLPCPELKSTEIIVDNKTSIDTTKSVDTKIEEIIVKGKSKFDSSLTSSEVILNTTPDSVDHKIYSYVQHINEKDTNGNLEGKLVIHTYGYNLKNWELDWKYTKEKVLIQETVVIERKDSTIIEKTNNFVQQDRKNLFFIGSSIGFNSGSIKDINLNATLQFKNYRQIYYEVGQTINTQDKLVHRVGVKVPIQFNRK